MKIALIGYGKMGKTIERIAKSRGHVISSIIDVTNQSELNELSKNEVDVAIEFTKPESAFNNLSTCIRNGIPVISGTTGWLDRLDEMKKICNDHAGTFLVASNFSLGVNIFFKLNKWLSKVMSPHKEYEVAMEEIHHTQKLDKPSGTAITLAEGVIDNSDQFDSWNIEENKDPKSININVLREPDVPGTHEIQYNSEVDQIAIKHTAHSRDGFALGAVLVAEWIQDKNGFKTMNDFINI